MATTALEAKTLKFQWNKLDKIQKKNFSAQDQSHTIFKMGQSTLMKRGEVKTVGGIFINYGELHYNY